MEGSTEGTAARKEEEQEEGMKSNMTGDHWAGGLYRPKEVISLPNRALDPKQARAPLTIYMGARAFWLEAKLRRHYESEGLLGSSLAGHSRRQSTTPDGYNPLTYVSRV